MPTLAALRTLIEDRFPDALPLTQRTAAPVATGLAGFDRILPRGGLPPGQLTVWHPEGASLTLLRAACHAALARGERTAWVDAVRTLGADWHQGPLLLRPRSRRSALRFAEGLLATGGLSLVVLTGVEPDQTETIRLSRAAHEGGGAFVAVTTRTLTAGVRLTSRFLPDDYRFVPTPFGDPAAVREVALAVEARASGWFARAVVRLPVQDLALRMALETAMPDRRGTR